MDSPERVVAVALLLAIGLAVVVSGIEGCRFVASAIVRARLRRAWPIGTRVRHILSGTEGLIVGYEASGHLVVDTGIEDEFSLHPAVLEVVRW